MRDIQKEIAKFIELVPGDRYAGFANPVITRDANAVTVVTVAGEEGETTHRVVVEWTDDNTMIDITRYDHNDDIIFHETIIREDIFGDCDPTVKYPRAIVDHKSAFCGDADCGIMVALETSINCKDLWKNTENRYKTLSDELKQIKKDITNPNVCWSPEDLAHKLVNEILKNMDTDWDE